MKKLIMTACLLLAGALVLTQVVPASAAAAGTLDSTFNPGGAGVYGPSFTFEGSIRAFAFQPDGKIIAGGSFYMYNGDASVPDSVMRLNANGTLDTTFNPGGAGARLDDVRGSVSGLALQPDGKILIGGFFNSYNGDAAAPDNLIRLNADGTRDTTFNSGGAGPNGGVTWLALQPDGKILIGGFFNSYNGDAAAPDNLIRLNADGTRDTSFNTGGAGTDSDVRSLALQSDGKIVIGGSFTAYNGDAAAPDHITRLNADGTRDTSFNSGGAGTNDLVLCVALQPDGKILIGGFFNSYNGDAAAPDNLIRLNADGTRDTSFNTGGTGANDGVQKIALQTDGKIIIGGNFSSYNGNALTPDHITRLNADGTLDTSFNSGGTGTNDSVNGLGLQPDGKILVGGDFVSYNGDESVPDHLLRLLGESNTASQTITVNTHAPASAVYGTTFTVAATSSSGLPVTYSSSGACTNNGATFTMTSGTGTCTVKFNQPGDGINYNAAPEVTETVTAQKAGQTINFNAPADKTFGDADFTAGAAASSGLLVSFSPSGQCTVTGSTVHLTGAGSCTLTASQGGDANYDAAPSVQRSFQIEKAAAATALSSSAGPSNAGQGVTFTATVTSAAGTPTGSVTFKDGALAIAGCEGRAVASGQATCTTTSLSVGSHTITADYSGDSNFKASTGTLSGGQVVGNIEFSQPLYTVAERGGQVIITVRRLGDTAQAASVDYATDDGSTPSAAVPCSSTTGLALERCDYTRAAGTLSFAAGEAEKTFTVLVGDDSFNEGAERTALRLSNPTGGAVLGALSSATLEIADDATDASAGINVVDDSETFVRQHYHDFLNREPDADGLKFWTEGIESCGASAGCREVKRVHTSAAFFLSIEFQQTGYFVERMYKVAYGDVTGSSNLGGAHQLSVPVVRLSEFLPDTQQIGRGVVVGVGDWVQRLETNRQAFALEFVRRRRFKDAFTSDMTAEQFVTRLDQNVGGILSADERAQLRDSLGSAPADDSKRAQALLQVADNAMLRQREKNRAFVLMQFFGYLRRDPDAAPDTNYTGYDFWLTKLNQFDGDFVRAEMVKAFITSDEYRKRFGQ